MQTSSQPKLLPVPFADAGSKQTIPNDSQIGITAGRASYTDGFPPLTRTPLAAGGVPPFGTDFNGVLNDITAAVRWSQSGASYPFNAAFNTAIGGYPKGARIPNSTLDGFWLNTTEGNTVNPENTTAALTGWVPSGFYGVTAIMGLSGSSITLTTLQAGRDRITLAGALTANINLIVPAWIKRWEIINNCTGSFSVTVKTPSGTGVPVSAGKTMAVFGDGTNIVTALAPGSLISNQVISSTGTYTPSVGTKTILVECIGGGGGGGGLLAPGTSGHSVTGGGGGGGYALSLISPVATSYSISIGSAGTGGTAGNAGGSGGSTSFGTLCVASGGGGGNANTTTESTTSAIVSIAGIPGVGTTGNILISAGERGEAGIGTANGNLGGAGGSSRAGRGGVRVGASAGNASNGSAGLGFGCGGSGAAAAATTTGAVGGAGTSGLVIIWEYA